MADTITKHRAVWNWLQTCPYIGDLFFNASRAEDGNTQLVPTESVVEEYIDGSKLINYNCALTRFMGFTPDPNDTANIAALEGFESVSDWVESQVEAGSIPAFPEGNTITEISVLPNQSGLAAQSMTLAKYMIQFQIQYMKE